MATVIAHVELPSTDVQKTAQFLEDVFGYNYKPFGNGYMLCNTQEGMTLGIRKADNIKGGDTPTFHFLVEDIEETLSKAKKAGGKVFKEKSIIPVYGYYALINDPDGNIIGLFQKSK